ncbi:MAG TPA: T9SS type A sorting domain-containing protein, partial [Candidatus Cloacimonadota bacterium]|nr:T9SS type A sorting domain-containing protein [Candidatus Cloacimonadota bacterium]
AFFTLLQTWFDTYKHQNVVTSEFKAMAEQISGQDLRHFFHQWIFGSGIPSVEYSIWNNPDSDSPGKILARTTSPTATQFEVDIPFKVTFESVSDSLMAKAGPIWTVNHYSQYLPLDAEIVANHNNWTLLRGLTYLRPEIRACLSSNSSVLLSWSAFMDDPALNYNLYRRQVDSDAWILVNDQPISGLNYFDTGVECNTSFEYILCAVDSFGWQSSASDPEQAQPQAFSFAYPLLVVDETRDGNGNSPIAPTDEMVDDFYDAALNPLSYSQWDCAAQGLPPLTALGENKVVLWHSEDTSQQLLSDYQETLCGYIIGGGKVILSGWKTPSVLEQSFFDLVAASAVPVYQNSPVFSGAQSQSYPILSVDPDKMLTPWNGMLPYSYSFQDVENPLYTDIYTDDCVIFRADQQTGEGVLVMSGIPFYCMEAAGVRGFLQQIIPELGSTENNDPVQKPQQIALHAYPNPFNPECTISFQLPEAGKTMLTLYNIRGQKVKTIASRTYEIGEHKVTLDASHLPSGVYTIQIKNGSHSQSKRITLMK